ncbi:DUF2779 domain-containing protein [Mycoplasma sp. E35C]|uniref:DUF2779 domain-containing protein n=1 Tax=Mycoplasma sp. E35C TaxID=2801918 RepID=UPI001CA3DDBF|nr:DUF2779 domain-containing protein [Mycoplasma sp. E35C]QZX49245.1 DUF2779 domain-containing protein [Mycoplasma sp. E35C]
MSSQKTIFKKTDFLNTFTRPKSLWRFNDTEIISLVQSELGLSNDNYDDLQETLEDEQPTLIDFDKIDFLTQEEKTTDEPLIFEITKLREKANEYIKRKILVQETDYGNLSDDNIEYQQKQIEDIVCVDVFDKKENQTILRIIDFSEFAKTPIVSSARLHEIIKNHDYSSSKLLILNGVYLNEKPNYYLQTSVQGILFEAISNSNRIRANLYTLKNSTGTKRKDVVSYYYDFQILTTLGYEISEWNIVLVKYGLSKRNDVHFTTTNYICFSKSGAPLTKPLKDALPKNKDYFDRDLIDGKAKFKRSGYYELSKDYAELNSSAQPPFVDLLDLFTVEFDQNNKEEKKIYKFQTEDLLEVRNAFNTVFDELLTIEQSSTMKLEISNQYWSPFFDNMNATVIKYALGKKYFEPFLLSGNVFNNTKFFDKNSHLFFPLENQKHQPFSIADFMNYVSANHETLKPTNYFETYKKVYKPEIRDTYVYDQARQEFAKLKDKKVYFDFESICHLFAPMDDVLPNMQIVTQNSYIIDKNDGTDLVCFNDVIDPQKLDVNWFIKIINDLHQGPDYSYVVYNATFERSRLYEMASYIERFKKYYPDAFNNKEDLNTDFFAKVREIDENLFDLAIFFNLHNKLLVVRSLNGFSSIKKVLLLTTDKNRKQAKAVDYATLNVRRGDIAQKLTAKRFLGLVSDQEWDEIKVDLATYCENDVRSMVAVEHYIRDLLASN